MKPFLKWPGGKQKLAGELIDRHLGKALTGRGARNYVEPFLGSGAVFLRLLDEGYLKGKNVYLSDGAQDLITLWRIVVGPCDKDFEEVLAQARGWLHLYQTQPTEEAAKEQYLELRADTLHKSTEIAARLLCLNGAGFNGQYRHSKKEGKYNVPPGKTAKGSFREYAKVRFEALQDVRETCLLAQHKEGTQISIRHAMIDENFKLQKKIGQGRNSVVYFDPPYAGPKGKAFKEYLPSGFPPESQEVVRNYHDWVWRSGGKAFQTNANDPLIQKLYSKFQVELSVEQETISRRPESRGSRLRVLIGGPK